MHKIAITETLSRQGAVGLFFYFYDIITLADPRLNMWELTRMAMAQNDQHNYDPNLKLLAQQLTKQLVAETDFSLKGSVEKLMKSEESFRKSIIKFAQARKIYAQFITEIVFHRKNILSAKPFFREKATTFSKSITPAIKAGDPKALQQFHINYNMISYIHKHWAGKLPPKSQKYFNQVEFYRNQIITNNVPLAINRAKIFYRKVPKSHLTLMDMVSIACMGLVSGVDKYVGAYSKVFNGVCIGRMVGNLIADYSDTMLYFYPSDRALLYRANAIKHRLNISNNADLAEAINKSYDEDRLEGVRAPSKKVSEGDVSHILQAASPVSTDQTSNDDDEFETQIINVRGYVSQDDVEKNAIKSDMMEKTALALKSIDVIYRKVIKLKGVEL